MLLLECTPDETVARKLGRPRKSCLHLNDKGRVCKRLQQVHSTVGLVDEDPASAQPGYFGELKIVSEEHDVRHLMDTARNNSVIVIRPRLEDWLIRTGELAGISIEDFGLSERPNELHREIISRLPALERFLDHLLAAGNARLSYLRKLIG